MFMIDIYNTLFDIVFNNGIIPDCKTVGVINPISKNKDDVTEPSNY